MTHIFRVEAAEKYGLFPAVVLGMIAYFVSLNEANNEHQYDGEYWVRITPAAFEKMYPYATRKQIRTALEKLIENGAIKKGYYNVNPFDKTAWYSITESARRDADLGACDVTNFARRDAQKGTSVVNNPDIYYTTEIKNIDLKTSLKNNSKEDKSTHLKDARDEKESKRKKEKVKPLCTAEEFKSFSEQYHLGIDADAFLAWMDEHGWIYPDGIRITSWKEAACYWADHPERFR